ncbi:MAG TPA: phage regulatory protein/antirepressor Ant [Bacteroidales bacterium]|nr:phage regulatory protein/antirepressor Ant [Bacteroidales bacterium]
MTELNLKTEQTMSTREIAALTGKKHQHVLRDVDILNDNYIKLGMSKVGQGYYTHPNTGNQQHREYLLTKIQTFDLMTGYNTELRIRVNRRWAELEAKQHQIPQTYSEALMLAAKQAEKLELQQSKINELEPKAEFYDSVTNSKSAIDIGRAAKVLDMGLGRNKLFQKLRNKGVLMHDNVPYQSYVDRGYFRIIETKFTKPDGSTHIQLKTLVYQKGLDYIRKILSD